MNKKFKPTPNEYRFLRQCIKSQLILMVWELFALVCFVAMLVWERPGGAVLAFAAFLIGLLASIMLLLQQIKDYFKKGIGKDDL